MTKLVKLVGAAGFLFTAGCAGTAPAPVSATGWAAHGYLTPGPTSDPEIIGTFATKAECDAAVNDWMSRQVVGNPVSGDCLPVDNY